MGSDKLIGGNEGKDGEKKGNIELVENHAKVIQEKMGEVGKSKKTGDIKGNCLVVGNYNRYWTENEQLKIMMVLVRWMLHKRIGF